MRTRTQLWIATVGATVALAAAAIPATAELLASEPTATLSGIVLPAPAPPPEVPATPPAQPPAEPAPKPAPKGQGKGQHRGKGKKGARQGKRK